MIKDAIISQKSQSGPQKHSAIADGESVESKKTATLEHREAARALPNKIDLRPFFPPVFRSQLLALRCAPISDYPAR
jgi:hypothetical protein